MQPITWGFIVKSKDRYCDPMSVTHDRRLLEELVPHPQPGRRFEAIDERLLDDDLRRLATSLPGANKGVVVAAEFAGPRGIADLVAFTSTSPDLAARLRADVPFVHGMSDCAVLVALSALQTRSSRTVASSAGMSEQQVIRRLRTLVSAGSVTVHGSGFRRRPEVKPIGRAYAFEAKVSNWRQGLSQALRYGSWCDAASVVLLRPPRDLSFPQQRFDSLGIGLAVQSRWVVRPRLHRPNAALRLALSERFADLASETEL